MPKISSKHQVTLPVQSLERAGLKAGDEVEIEAEGRDRIVVKRAEHDRTRALGVFDGLYEPGYLDRLRAGERGVSACVLDTDVMIAALDRSDAHHRAAARALRAMIEEGTEILLSLVNYAETLVRPAEDQRTIRVAVEAIRTLGVGLVPPTAAIARDAARYRTLKVSLADGFALATAAARDASVASFDRRVRRALPRAGLRLAGELG